MTFNWLHRDRHRRERILRILADGREHRVLGDLATSEIGKVYVVLARLEREGTVTSRTGGDGRRCYRMAQPC